jgi:hypothetical protein
MMKSAPPRTKSLATAIIVGLVGIGILAFLAMSGLPGLKDTRTSTVRGQSIIGKKAWAKDFI